MDSDNYNFRKEKWDKKQSGYKVNSARRATLFLTLKNALELLGQRRQGRLLDIGCGFGELAILMAQHTDFEIVGFDLSGKTVEAARRNVKRAGLENRIKIEEGDVFNMSYPDNYFDAAMSFGYVSAATYPGIQKGISRVLKTGAPLVCDFINCASFYKILSTLRRILKKKFAYYLSLSGIKKEFGKAGFEFEEQRFFATYPPFDLNISPKVFLAFENTLGRLFKSSLARVRLVCFPNKM